MNKKTLTIAALVVVAVIVAFVIGRLSAPKPEITASGSTPTSTQLIEDYVPIVKYNGGLHTALPIQTTSDFTASAATFSSTLTGTSATLSGDITQSTSNTSTTTFAGGCIQTTATSTDTPVRFVLQATTTIGNSVQGSSATNNFVVLAQYGSCPI